MSKVKVSKARIIELAATHSKPEVAKELGITVTTLNKLVDGLNIVFKAKRNKYELVDDVDVESVSGVNPIVYHTVVGEMHEQEEVEQIDTTTKVNNITNTSVPVVEEDVKF